MMKGLDYLLIMIKDRVSKMNELYKSSEAKLESLEEAHKRLDLDFQAHKARSIVTESIQEGDRVGFYPSPLNPDYYVLMSSTQPPRYMLDPELQMDKAQLVARRLPIFGDVLLFVEADKAERDLFKIPNNQPFMKVILSDSFEMIPS